jgi:hypothetical protein
LIECRVEQGFNGIKDKGLKIKKIMTNISPIVGHSKNQIQTTQVEQLNDDVQIVNATRYNHPITALTNNSIPELLVNNDYL